MFVPQVQQVVTLDIGVPKPLSLASSTGVNINIMTTVYNYTWIVPCFVLVKNSATGTKPHTEL